MKKYTGSRGGDGVTVMANGVPLKPRYDLYNHSPDGFEWGYGGSGPSQLALALVADHIGDDDMALQIYQQFKWKIVSGLPHGGWTLTSDQIAVALAQIAQEDRGAS